MLYLISLTTLILIALLLLVLEDTYDIRLLPGATITLLVIVLVEIAYYFG